MNRSTNFNFYLPENTDPIDVNDLNYNFEQIDEEIFETNGALNTINNNMLYGLEKGAHSLEYTPVYGFITTNGTVCDIYFPCMIRPDVSSISIQQILISIRHPSGGYVGGASLFDATSYVTYNVVGKTMGVFRIMLTKSDGWGLTNNIPIIGTANVNFTLS